MRNINKNLKTLKRRVSAFTLVEAIISLISLSLLFIVLFSVVKNVQVATGRGHWIHASVTELRNAVRLISTRISQSSYPTTIINKANEKDIFTLKEIRKYDDRGRMTEVTVSGDTSKIDFHAIEGTFLAPKASEGPKRLMVAAICDPELESDSGNSQGQITWFALELERSSETGLGRLRQIEWIENYSTTSLPLRVADSSWSPSFNPRNLNQTIPGNRTVDRIIVNDISSIAITKKSVMEFRGYARDSSGTRSDTELFRERSVISINLCTAYPKDGKLVIADRAVASTFVDVALDNTNAIIVTSTLPGSSAVINGVSYPERTRLYSPLEHLFLEQVMEGRVRLSVDNKSFIVWQE